MRAIQDHHSQLVSDQSIQESKKASRTLDPHLPSQPDDIEMTLPAIQHRRVTESDRDTLLSMRKSCGWGSNRIDSYLSEPTMATYLFYRSSEDGQEQPVGMGCLVFDLPEDPAMASRETRTIAIGKCISEATINAS